MSVVTLEMCPIEELLDELDELITKGQMLEVWKKIEPLKPLSEWKPGRQLRLAALIASRLGNNRLSYALDYLNYRADRTNPKWALYYQFRRVRFTIQPAVIKTIDVILEHHRESMEAELLADYLVYKAWLLASLKDFHRAGILIAEAKLVAPDHAWVYVEASDILEQQDRYEEANKEADKALALRPNYHAAVLRKEMVLFHLNRDDEAIALLEKVNSESQHGVYGVRLQYRYSERDDTDKMLWALGEYVKYSPLLGKKDKQWLAARRGDCHYLQGDYQKALTCYGEFENGFYKTLHDKLEQSIDTDCVRKKLNVAFVRQHDMTCAPATLAALSQYYGEPKDHLEIAEAICYDGTPWHKERGWAEQNGFLVYEFKFSQAMTKALIDRGLPFTLSTHAVTSAHLQACIGYDDRLGIAIIRDPTNRHYGEMLFEDLVEQHPVYGPRGMLFIPKDKKYLLEGVVFEDQIIYDSRYQLILAIDSHNEMKMQEAVSTMKAIADGHPLVINSETILARYRNNYQLAHELYEKLHQRFPKDDGLEFDYFRSSISQSSRQNQLKIALKAVSKENVDPVFYAELGDLYIEDMRELDQAEFYLNKSARYTFSNARSMASLALCKYRKNELSEALEYRRYSSCQNSGWEPYAASYFHYACEIGKEDEALEFLKQRTENQGVLKSASWITLSQAYEKIHDDGMAREIILNALEKFPEDGDLLVHITMNCHPWGQGDEAEGYLEKAKAVLSEEEWHTASGRLARSTGDRKKALRHYKRVTELNPTWYAAQEHYTSLLEEDYSSPYVLKYMEGLVAEHGDCMPLLELYGMKLSEADDARTTEVLQKMLQLEPNNMWALREQALVYEKKGEIKVAIDTGKLAITKQPNQCENIGVLAGILARADRKDEAIENFKQAILLDADYTYAISSWVGLLENIDEKREALEFYESQMWAQEIVGNSIHVYRELAYRYVEPADLLTKLRAFREKHEAEWAAWTAEKNQLLDMDKADEALSLMDKAVEKFRYIPRIYQEKATVHKALGDNKSNIEYLEKTLKLSPSWDWIARELAEAYEYEGEHKKAEEVLKKAMYWSPLNPANGGCLADQLERLGKKDEAFDILAKTLKVSPNYDWGWREISSWAKVMEREGDVIKMLDEHHESRAELVSWQESCFNVYDVLGRHDEALEFCDATLEKHPKNVDMHDSKAYLLARTDRVDEAIQATKPMVYGEDTPPMLVSRRALITYSYINPREGMKLMETLYAAHSDWVQAPMYLSRWHYEFNENEEAEKYTNEWLRLAPQSHHALGQLGAISEEKKQFEKSADYYKKAFQLNPEYSYAGYRAFELILEHGDLDDVPQIIQLTRHFGRETEALEMDLRYEDKKGNKKVAFDLFDAMMRREDVLIEEVRKAEDLFPTYGAKRIVEIVEKGEAKSPAVLQAWLWGRSNFMRCTAKIVKLPYPKEMKYPLWVDLINWLVSMDDDEGVVKKLYNKYYKEFSEDTNCLAYMLHACANFDEYKIGCRIAPDLLIKKDLRDWMLTAVTYCQVVERGLLETEKTIDEGLKLRKENGADLLLGMKAIIEGARGNVEYAEHLLSMREEEMEDEAKSIGCIAQMMIASMKGDIKTQKNYWFEFKQRSPEWRNKKYFLKLVEYCRKGAKVNGKKWLGKRSFYNLKLSSNYIIYLAIAIFVIIRIAYKMYSRS